MKRNFGLDAIRAFSIWLVILRHAGFNLGFPINIEIGVIGVKIFFVLSGFLIGGILIKDLLNSTSFSTLKKFWIRRWFRILPVYYLMLILKFIIIDHSVGWHIIYYFLFLQSNIYGITFYTVTWSLVIEEWFYIFVPLFLIFVFSRVKHDMKKIVMYLFLFFLIENMIRIVYVYYTKSLVIGGNPLFWLDSLFVGVFIAVVKKMAPASYKILQSTGVFIAGLVVFVAYIYFTYIISIPHLTFHAAFFPETIGMFLFSVSIGLIIPRIEKYQSFDTTKPYKKVLFNAITQTSLLTYSIYLIHPLVYGYIARLNLKTFYIQVIIEISITYVLAFLVYKFFEKPFLQLRDRIEKR